MEECFGLSDPVLLYGRCNSITDGQDRPIADVVEILPPETFYRPKSFRPHLLRTATAATRPR